MEHPCLDRTQGQAEAFGDLRLCEVFVLSEAQHLTMGRSQGVDRFADHQGLQDLVDVVALGG